jgi:hypothetical protein
MKRKNLGLPEETLGLIEEVASAPGSWKDNKLARREALLGMSFSTAVYRLQKIVLWDLLRQVGYTDCYRCSEPMTFADFSLDHREPWENVSADLFWDPRNVEWSHLDCNQRASAAGRRRRSVIRNSPLGMSWCSTHKSYLPIDRFSKARNSPNGVHSLCRDCRSVYDRRPRGQRRPATTKV